MHEPGARHDLPQGHPCDVLRDAHGRPVLALPPGWAGLPLGLFNIPGVADCGALGTQYPTLLIALAGHGERWYRSMSQTRHLRTAPGMIELYPDQLEFDRMAWHGEAGHCIGIHFTPETLSRLLHDDRGVDLVRQHEVFDTRLQWLAGELLEAARSGHEDPLYVEGLSLALLGRLRQRGSLTRAQPRRAGRFSAPLLERLQAFIAEHLSSELSIARLAEVACMSPDHFAHCFKLTFGMPPHRYVQRQRIAAGQRLLRDTRMPIAQVAVEVGFASQSHFTQAFRAHTGTTPARWRQG